MRFSKWILYFVVVCGLCGLLGGVGFKNGACQRQPTRQQSQIGESFESHTNLTYQAKQCAVRSQVSKPSQQASQVQRRERLNSQPRREKVLIK